MVPRQVLPDFFIVQKGMDTDLTVDFSSLIRFVPSDEPISSWIGYNKLDNKNKVM
jgi:hypothetical protein